MYYSEAELIDQRLNRILATEPPSPPGHEQQSSYDSTPPKLTGSDTAGAEEKPTYLKPNKGSRKAFHKLVRQMAHKEGIPFETALDKIIAPPAVKVLLYSPTTERRNPRRNPGRMDGTQWNGSAFISGSKVDDGELFVREEDVYDLKIDFIDTQDTRRHHTDMTISLLDIARPAKPKGVAKDFEVVQKVRNVIALDDDSFAFGGLEYQWEDDDWDQIYDDWHAEEQRSYSSRFNDRRDGT
ncbi:hypothetical protein BYT27DRAFT_7263296 [Phlegmacium glaucopus]|nr:hypothetical protein BYT27DRAFT_7263296 [Phlegmacium glaucopus]